MKSFIQDTSQKTEAGGVLLGRFIIDSKNIVIDKVTVPMIGDERSRHKFIRGEKMHQRVITNAWKKSIGTCNYLGEWHTHPQEYPTPSSQDIKNWKEILSTRTFSSQYLYFIIIGTKEIRIWEGSKRFLEIKRLI
ncbi:MAG: Mov34/MPN/PAD-1 family protein [Bacteroidota bacterium]